MPTTDFKKTKCLFCDWSDRTHRLPNHLVKHHPEKIVICDVQYDHCLRAYVRCKKIDVDFAVCLTCKKGTIAETYSGNGMRWINMHSKKEECRAAHANALTLFKAVQEDASDSPVEVATAVAVEVPIVNSLEVVWMRIKEDPRTRPAAVDIEDRSRTMYEDDSDNDGTEFTLDIMDSIKQLARDAIGFKKEMERQKAIVSDHESRLKMVEQEIAQARYEKEYFRQQNASMLAELKMLRELVSEKQSSSE